jgi:RIO-like serine/threonine protein kinase
MTEFEALLKDEVVELTDLMRRDDSFEALRSILMSKGLHVRETILAGLIDSEDMSQYGVLLTRDARLVLFDVASDGTVRQWDVVADPESLEADFQAVGVAIALQRTGEIA